MRPVFKCHGGKFYLAPWVISQFPQPLPDVYLEPFCGAGSVVLNKPRSVLEVVNDIDPGVISIYRALRDRTYDFISRLRSLTYCEGTFAYALQKVEFTDNFDRAVNEYILRRMSRGGLKTAFSWSKRLRGGRPGDVNGWVTAIAGLPQLADRLHGVCIYNGQAVDVIRNFDTKDVLHYCDPPYLSSVRTAKKAYAYEMTDAQHTALAGVLRNCKGKVIISGYKSYLYDRLYEGWNTVEKEVANHSSQAKNKARRVEVLWKNY